MQYFQVPKPTGSLLTAVLSYGDVLFTTCTASGTAMLACPSPPASKWCGFTTAAPTGLLPEYSAYGSAASSWVSQHTSTALDLAHKCPNGWYNAMWDTPGGSQWLNQTLIFAECFKQELPKSASSSGTSLTKSTPTTTSLSRATPTAPRATGATVSNGVRKTGKHDKWLVVGTGLAAATIPIW
jgi:hypothetical protein